MEVRLLTDRLISEQRIKIGEPPRSTTYTLSTGLALHSLLLRIASHFSDQPSTLLQESAGALEQGAKSLSGNALNASMFGGVAGYALALNSFPEPALIGWREDLLSDIDELLRHAVQTTLNPDMDFVKGASGVLMYATERGNSSNTGRKLLSVLETLVYDYIERWLATTPSQREIMDFGNNLGVSHGLPGLLSVASIATYRKYFGSKTRNLLVRAFDELWRARLDVDGLPYFPYRYDLTEPARLAWCYGNLGIAIAFRNAARVEHENTERFLEIVKSCLRQCATDGHGMNDASLCHGYAGASLIFSYFANCPLLDAPLSETASRASLGLAKKALAAAEEDNGFLIFKHHYIDRYHRTDSLLEGTPGVAYSLACTQLPTTSEKYLQFLSIVGD